METIVKELKKYWTKDGFVVIQKDLFWFDLLLHRAKILDLDLELVLNKVKE